MSLDCWLSCRRHGHDHILRQLPSLSTSRCHGGSRCRPHFTFNCCGMLITSLRPRSHILTVPDYLDILFWIYSCCSRPSLHRPLCTEQRVKRFPWPGAEHEQCLQPSRYHFRSASPDVHISTAQRLRDFFSSIRLPRWACRFNSARFHPAS